MYVCKNCGHHYSTYVNFCGRCNGELARVVPKATVPPSGSPYTPVAAAPMRVPVVPAGAKVKGFIGMGVGIEGLICSCFAILFAIIMLGFAADASIDVIFAFIPSIIMFSVIGEASGIVALCLSKSSRNSGFISKATGVGTIFGIISMAVCGLSFLMIFISAAIS